MDRPSDCSGRHITAEPEVVRKTRFIHYYANHLDEADEMVHLHMHARDQEDLQDVALQNYIFSVCPV